MLRAKGSDKEWTTSGDEIRAYFGFMILMGINRLPEIRDYWSTNQLLHYSPIANRISRDRFEEITRYLHFVDNTFLSARGEPNFSRLQKIQPILTTIRERLSSTYAPHCQVSVDEAMVPFKGRSTMKQYMPIKPIKRGFKIWVVADAINGYFYDLIPYTGATPGDTCMGLGEKVVLELTHSLFGKYHQIYCDNFFSTIPLFRTLYNNKTYACGTIRTNRKHFPKNILLDANSINRGEHRFSQSAELVAFVWKDNKPVTSLSTLSDPQATTIVHRRQRDGTSLGVSCPLAIKLYNEFMGGVDKGDQLRVIIGFD